MKDIGQLLREADPLAHERGVLPDDAQAMRRAIVAAAEQKPTIAWWPRPMVVAATIAVTLVAGVAVGRWLPSRDTAAARRGTAPPPSAASHDRRQLQFATPGGTRVIWVFNPDFRP